jgi:hypothetical protein
MCYDVTNYEPSLNWYDFGPVGEGVTFLPKHRF